MGNFLDELRTAISCCPSLYEDQQLHEYVKAAGELENFLRATIKETPNQLKFMLKENDVTGILKPFLFKYYFHIWMRTEPLNKNGVDFSDKLDGFVTALYEALKVHAKHPQYIFFDLLYDSEYEPTKFLRRTILEHTPACLLNPKYREYSIDFLIKLKLDNTKLYEHITKLRTKKEQSAYEKLKLEDEQAPELIKFIKTNKYDRLDNFDKFIDIGTGDFLHREKHIVSDNGRYFSFNSLKKQTGIYINKNPETGKDIVNWKDSSNKYWQELEHDVYKQVIEYLLSQEQDTNTNKTFLEQDPKKGHIFNFKSPQETEKYMFVIQKILKFPEYKYEKNSISITKTGISKLRAFYHNDETTLTHTKIADKTSEQKPHRENFFSSNTNNRHSKKITKLELIQLINKAIASSNSMANTLDNWWSTLSNKINSTKPEATKIQVLEDLKLTIEKEKDLTQEAIQGNLLQIREIVQSKRFGLGSEYQLSEDTSSWQAIKDTWSDMWERCGEPPPQHKSTFTNT